VATAQILRFEWAGAFESSKTPEDQYWIDLCLTPRPRALGACYSDRWRPRRFERVGEVLVLPPGEAVQIRAEAEAGGSADGIDRHSSIVCRLDPQQVAKWFEEDVIWSDFHLKGLLDLCDPSVRGLLTRLAKETIAPGFASRTMVDLLACQLAIELSRHGAASDGGAPKGGLAGWRLRLIDQRLAEPGRAPTLAELADLCNLSVRQLSRGFRASRGCSIGYHVERSRIDYAKRLLAAGETIKKVSHCAGFSSPSSFSYAFRRATGASPGQFRNLA
jgi:AraC family transcriptional regulator